MRWGAKHAGCCDGECGEGPVPCSTQERLRPQGAEQKPKALVAISLAGIDSKIKGGGEGGRVGDEAQDLSLCYPQHGLCQVIQLFSAFPNINQGQGCCTQLCSLPESHIQEGPYH